MAGSRAMVAHHAAQCGAVTPPVGVAQNAGGFEAQLQMLCQVSRHGAVDVRKNVCAGIVQRVVQIKQPDRFQRRLSKKQRRHGVEHSVALFSAREETP